MNHGCEYNQIMMNPPAHATITPLKTIEVVGTERNWKYRFRKIMNIASGRTTINVFCDRT